jgi:hypothetical protein
MTPIENRSKISAFIVKLTCKLLKGHFGTKNGRFFSDPKNPRCSICGVILTQENHFHKYAINDTIKK